MTGELPDSGCAEISSTIADWLVDLGRLLQCVERVIENSRPMEDCPIEVKSLLPLLLPLIRQCRSQVPSEEMIEVWVRSVQQRLVARPMTVNVAEFAEEA